MKYYELLEELVEKLMNGEMTQDEYDEATLKLLDDVLSKHDDDAVWLSYHYNGAADYLLDNPDTEMSKDYLFNMAEKEIEIFRKNGFDTTFMESMLNEAKEMEDA